MSSAAQAEAVTPAARGLTQLMAALLTVFETVCEVFDEAGDMSAEARQRFPLAD